MSDNGKHADAEMAKAIFISADCWLGVFDLLPPSQLGLGIAMISHRFNIYVDEHYKTRLWSLRSMEILRKMGDNGTKQMEIVNSKGKAMPIPQIDVPSKVSGFECIIINYIDGTVIAFLLHFRQLFAACQINLSIVTLTFSALELFFSRNLANDREKYLWHGIHHECFRTFATIGALFSQCMFIALPCLVHF
ncbi:hypothetical protein niasHT_032920 [Heterodera trifolii]|uniref:Uncharacterized protein n=1 Tax=Heterodera trifolii TaxID=157864 RepID=A0ABD2IP34_9BILA